MINRKIPITLKNTKPYIQYHQVSVMPIFYTAVVKLQILRCIKEWVD